MFDIYGYKKIIESFYSKLQKIPEEMTDLKPSDGSWTLKEITGHLIDSAANNHQRIVRLQEGNLEGFPSYNNEKWIKIQGYVNANWVEFVFSFFSFESVRTSTRNKIVFNKV